MAECELHVLRARLEGGSGTRRARGELRAGFRRPDLGRGRRGDPLPPRRGSPPASCGPCSTGSPCAGRCAPPGCGCASRAALALAEGRLYPARQRDTGDHLGEPTYHAVHTTLTHPAYAGAYVLRPDPQGTFTLTAAARCASAAAACPATSGRSSSPITPPGSPTGIPTRTTRPASAATSGRRPASPGTGAVREGSALLQGHGHLREMRPQARRLLRRPGEMRAELLLPGLRRAG